MSCGQNDITKSPDHVNFVTLKIEKRSLVTYSTAITIMTRLQKAATVKESWNSTGCLLKNDFSMIFKNWTTLVYNIPYIGTPIYRSVYVVFFFKFSNQNNMKYESILNDRYLEGI